MTGQKLIKLRDKKGMFIKENKVKPTKKQRQTFEHMKTARSLQEAMLAGGYSKSTSLKPKQNFTDLRGVNVLLKEYKGHLENAGISPKLLAEIQAEGLFDQNAQTRLGYLKETKKDFGIIQEEKAIPQTQVNIFARLAKEDKEFIEREET